MFSYEFCKISKNTFYKEHLWTTAAVKRSKKVCRCSPLEKHWLQAFPQKPYTPGDILFIVLSEAAFFHMQQIYRRTPMTKCDFNKVAKQLYWNQTSARVFNPILLHIFRTPFYKNTFEGLRLFFYNKYLKYNYYLLHYLWTNLMRIFIVIHKIVGKLVLYEQIISNS